MWRSGASVQQSVSGVRREGKEGRGVRVVLPDSGHGARAPLQPTRANHVLHCLSSTRVYSALKSVVVFPRQWPSPIAGDCSLLQSGPHREREGSSDTIRVGSQQQQLPKESRTSRTLFWWTHFGERELIKAAVTLLTLTVLAAPSPSPSCPSSSVFAGRRKQVSGTRKWSRLGELLQQQQQQPKLFVTSPAQDSLHNVLQNVPGNIDEDSLFSLSFYSRGGETKRVSHSVDSNWMMISQDCYSSTTSRTDTTTETLFSFYLLLSVCVCVSILPGCPAILRLPVESVSLTFAMLVGGADVLVLCCTAQRSHGV